MREYAMREYAARREVGVLLSLALHCEKGRKDVGGYYQCKIAFLWGKVCYEYCCSTNFTKLSDPHHQWPIYHVSSQSTLVIINNQGPAPL